MNDLALARFTRILREIAAFEGTLPSWSDEPPAKEYKEWADEWLLSQFGEMRDALQSASLYAKEFGLSGDSDRLSELHRVLSGEWYDYNLRSAVEDGVLPDVFDLGPPATGDENLDEEIKLTRILSLIGNIIKAARFAGELAKSLVDNDDHTESGKRRKGRFSREEKVALEDKGTRYLRQNPKARRESLARHLGISEGAVSSLFCWRARNGKRGGAKSRAFVRGRIGLDIAFEQNAKQEELKQLEEEQRRDAEMDGCPEYEPMR